VVKEIRDIPECGSIKLSGFHQIVVGLSSAFLTLASAFFWGFTVAGLVTAAGLCLGFLDLAVFQATVTLGCLGISVTG
jgi:hypothetical protein